MHLAQKEDFMAQVSKTTNPIKDNFYPIAAVIIVILGVFFAINSAKTNPGSTTQETPATASSSIETESAKPKTLAYRGQDGKTALELLKGAASIETSGEGAMAFVTTINDYKPDINKEFWALYVNGKQAEVGAGSLSTKGTDMIEWRLEQIKP